jgi:hypothetical protein
MLTIALVGVLATALGASSDGPEPERTAVGGCPYGDIQIVSSKAKADYSVRFVSSAAKADCVVRWVSVAPGPGQWRRTSSFPDVRIYPTNGIADLTVYAQ